MTVIDDFAHHPTAITETLAALRGQIGSDKRIIAVIEPRSNTMKMGTMKDRLADSLKAADEVVCYAAPSLGWDVEAALSCLGQKAHVKHDIDEVVKTVVDTARPDDFVLVMSNGGFGGIHGKLLSALKGA